MPPVKPWPLAHSRHSVAAPVDLDHDQGRLAAARAIEPEAAVPEIDADQPEVAEGQARSRPPLLM
jgi:hypothetical protein